MKKRHGVTEDGRFSYILGLCIGFKRNLILGDPFEVGRPGTTDGCGSCSVDRWRDHWSSGHTCLWPSWYYCWPGFSPNFNWKDHTGLWTPRIWTVHLSPTYPKQVKAISLKWHLVPGSAFPWTGSSCAVLNSLTLSLYMWGLHWWLSLLRGVLLVLTIVCLYICATL